MNNNGHTSFFIGMPMEDVESDEQITVDQLQRVIRLIESSDVTELEVKHGKQKARVVLRKVKPLLDEHLQTEALAVGQATACSSEPEHYTITAPFVGIFQSWSTSKEKPLTAVGEMIKEGQHVGVIRALDVPNEVEASATGRVVEFLVQDGQPVEYGQPLLTIDKY